MTHHLLLPLFAFLRIYAVQADEGIICNTEEVQAGTSDAVVCYNGGVCRENQVANVLGSHFSCSCGRNPDDGFYYGGVSCQNQIDGMTVCNEDELRAMNGDGSIDPHLAFRCFHHSKCVMDDETNEWSCECQDDPEHGIIYRGDHCEHRANDICHPHKHGPAPGDLHACFQGQCRPHEHFGDESGHPHCICNEGWHGLDCTSNSGDNNAGITCPDGETTCLNGSTCVKIFNHASESSETRKHLYRCDCHAADKLHNTHFVGKQCEIYYGDININPDIQLCRDPHFDHLDGVNHSICLNGGTCSVNISHISQDHVQCDCPSNFEGLHCEIPNHVAGSVSDSCIECEPGSNDCHTCLNGGVCDAHTFLVDKASVCICPTGFIGPSCEVNQNASETIEEQSESGSGIGLESIFVFIGVFAGGFSSAFIVLRFRTRRSAKPATPNEDLTMIEDVGIQQTSVVTGEVSEVKISDNEVV